MTKIALIGTGIMGAGMGHNLLKAGYPLTIWNRTAAKAQPLIDAGARLAATPGQAASGADMIITIVGDDASSREVWLGPDGILSGTLKPKTIAVESTTISLAWAKELHQILGQAGLRSVDCPVTGGRTAAERGTLTLLIGADEETLGDAQSIFAAFSQNTIRFGPPGAGTAYKLMVNLMSAVHAVALAEGIALAEKAGLDMERVVEGLISGAAASPMVKGFAKLMADGDHDTVHFSSRWQHKDATYGVKMASELGQALPLSAVAPQLFQMVLNQGLGDKNVSAVVEALR